MTPTDAIGIIRRTCGADVAQLAADAISKYVIVDSITFHGRCVTIDVIQNDQHTEVEIPLRSIGE